MVGRKSRINDLLRNGQEVVEEETLDSGERKEFETQIVEKVNFLKTNFLSVIYYRVIIIKLDYLC